MAASATRVRTLCAVGWESPTGVSDFWRFLAVNRAPPGVAPDDSGGSFREPVGPEKPDHPERPPTAPGLAVRSRALEAPRPCRSKRRSSPPLASKSALRKDNSNLDASHRNSEPHRRAPSRTRGRARDRFEAPLSMRAVDLRHEMRRTFRRTTHFSKNEYPISTSPSGPAGFRSEGPASVALHGASLASDRPCSRARRHFAPTRRSNRRSFDAPFRIASLQTA